MYPSRRCLRFDDFLHRLAWPWTAAWYLLHCAWSCIPSDLAKPFSHPKAPQNLQWLDADQLDLTVLPSPYPICQQAGTRLLLCNTLDRRCHPHNRWRLQLQRRWDYYNRIPNLREPIVRTLPTYPFQHGSGDYLWLAASRHLHVTSQGQLILVASSLASEPPEVEHRATTPLFDVWLVVTVWGWVWVPRWHLCRSAFSRLLRLQCLVLCSSLLLWIPHLGSSVASWPMDCTRSSA